jgi:hypothetical protein
MYHLQHIYISLSLCVRVLHADVSIRASLLEEALDFLLESALEGAC